MKPRYFLPLLGFVLPIVVSGFSVSILGAYLTYWAGVRTVYRDLGAR